MLSGKSILLIVTGSIAAYKALELARLLTKSGASVEGVLTRGGAAFITPLSLATLTGKPTLSELWDERAYQMNHIELSRRADLIVIAPATAGIIAKMAHGIGDDLASSALLARNKPVLLAPSMNTEMWDNPALRRNLAQIEADGATIVPPQSDTLACGETGVGKMAEPQTILAAIQAHFQRKDALAGRSAIVTTGGTIERIDAVRYISNFSSGKQGNAVALSLAQAGAAVTLIAGNVSGALPSHPNISIRRVESAEQMKEASHAALPADVFVACAAVCDFRVANRSTRKIKKEAGLQLNFEENPDIARSIGSLPAESRPKLVVCFAAETENLLDNARRKLVAKSCDLVLANDVSQGAVFGKDENKVHLVSENLIQEVDNLPKSAVADILTDWIRDRLKP